LTRDVGFFGVRLRTHRDVLARRHRHRAGDHARHAGAQDFALPRRCSGDADHKACGGDDAVIGAQHGGPQPAYAGNQMAFGVQTTHHAVRIDTIEGLATARARSTFSRRRRIRMTKIVYEIVEHDHGWAFKLGDTISQSFLTHEAAYNAAKRAALEQMQPGETVGISWEDARGCWHDEISSGDDRPDVEVHDRP